MKLFRYKEDRLPIFIILSYFLLDITVYLTIDSIPLLIAWTILGIWPKGNICAWNHHHQHCYTFNQYIPNRLLEIVYALQTGITGFAWVLHHNLGHHLNYLDQSKDESRWMTSDKKTMGRIRYAIEVSATSYYRAFQVGKKYPKIQKQFIATVTVVLLILSALVYYKPISAFFVFLMPMLISLICTANATYDHHSDLDTDNPVEASRNIISSPWYNRLTGNLGYHTAHHIKFGVHWSKLPALHEKYAEDIPAECYNEPMILFTVLDNLSEQARKLAPLFRKRNA